MESNMSILSCTQETIHLFHQFMSPSYHSKIDMLQNDLAKFFDGLIWAQHKNPLLVYQMFEMKALNQIVQKYIHMYPIIILKNTILLLSNCEKTGLVAEQLAEHQYPHFLIENIFQASILTKFKQEIEQYFGSFLKCYHRIFRIEWLSKFVLEDEYFQLMEINLKFFNCKQLITRTSALNIVLDLLSYKDVRSFIFSSKSRYLFYQTIFDRMTKLFRNQIAELGLRIAHISKQDNVQLILRQLEDKISLWQDISQSSEGLQNILHLNFSFNILFPLIAGPIQPNQVPLFSLKFSLFVVRSLMPTLRKLGVLQIYIRMVFIEQKILYYPHSLRKAMIEPFKFEKLVSRQIVQQEEEDDKQIYQPSIKSFYLNLLKSKDNHFILMTNSLLCVLFTQVHRDQQLSSKYGFDYGGSMYSKIGNIMIEQMQSIHQLHTVESILNTLVTISKGKCMDTELQNQYIFNFQQIIEQIRQYIKTSNESISYLVETIEYDISIIDKLQFATKENNQKYLSMFKVVFMWEIHKQEQYRLSFYSRVPQSPSDYLRYSFVKFMLLLKARSILLQGYSQESILQHYYSQIVTHCPFLPGDIYRFSQFESEAVPCEMIKQKAHFHLFLIKDNDFFVLAQPMISKQGYIQILQGCKIKHVAVKQISKKKIAYLEIRQFCPLRSQIIPRKKYYLKVTQQATNAIQSSMKICINKHISFIRECLENTKVRLPNPSLI